VKPATRRGECRCEIDVVSIDARPESATGKWIAFKDRKFTGEVYGGRQFRVG